MFVSYTNFTKDVNMSSFRIWESVLKGALNHGKFLRNVIWYTVNNDEMMRQLYSTFQNTNALRSELSWTHYRSLMRVEDEATKYFYLPQADLRIKKDCAQNAIHKMCGWTKKWLMKCEEYEWSIDRYIEKRTSSSFL